MRTDRFSGASYSQAIHPLFCGGPTIILWLCVFEDDKLSDALSKAIANINHFMDDSRSVHEGELWEKIVGLRDRMDALRVELDTPLPQSFNWDNFWNTRDDR